MNKILINKISGFTNIFSKVPKTVQNTSNPFGTAFKGNLISADIFDAVKTTSKSKLVSGAVLSAYSKLAAGLESAITFGNKIKSATRGFWEKANSVKIEDYFVSLGKTIKNQAELIQNPYSVKKLVKRPVPELENLMKLELGIAG